MSSGEVASEPSIPPERPGSIRGPALPWSWPEGARRLLAVVAITAAIALGVASRDREQGRGRGQATGPPVPRSLELVLDANTATPEALEALPHVGPTLARRIADARGDGPFRSADDLRARVRGIGPVTLARIAPYLRFDGTDVLEVGHIAGTDRARPAAAVAGRKPPASRKRRAGTSLVQVDAKARPAADRP